MIDPTCLTFPRMLPGLLAQEPPPTPHPHEDGGECSVWWVWGWYGGSVPSNPACLPYGSFGGVTC